MYQDGDKLKRLFVIFLSILFVLLSSCYEPIPGSGNLIKYEETFPLINSITLYTFGQVYITSGSPQKVEIEVDDNFQKNVFWDYYNKKLSISTKGIIKPTQFNVYITIADISELINEGSGDIIVQNNFNQGSQLWLTVTGSGNIIINSFNASDCSVYNSGAGNIMANSGTIVKGDYLLKDIGSINFSSVVNRYVLARNTGSGKMLFTVTDSLNATIQGSGNIEYWGNPPVITKSITGTGQLKKRN